jgi:hypothetical protein
VADDLPVEEAVLQHRALADVMHDPTFLGLVRRRDDNADVGQSFSIQIPGDEIADGVVGDFLALGEGHSVSGKNF